MIKRIFDVIFAFLVLLALFPFFPLVMLLIKIDSSGPVFYFQTRVGKDFKQFKLIKFRTMYSSSEIGQLSVTVNADKRITKIGKILRRYKIDELPQFINVLKGEMSIVGPRPEVPNIVATYTEEQKKVLSVKPGITSLASIEYCNEEEDMPEDLALAEKVYLEQILPIKLRYNLTYLERASMLYDIALILRTIKVLFIKQKKHSL